MAEKRGLVIPIALVAVTAALYAGGMPLGLAAAIVLGASPVALTVEILRAKGVVSETTYWSALMLGEGLLLLLAALITKGVIPLALAVTGDLLIDAFITSTIAAVVGVTAAYFLPRFYGKIAGEPEVYSSPYLE
ncbi:MAG: hypothetical protein ABWK00_05850 [Desulfurococcaceae archaeon]